ncbi:EAL domain-containing protein [Erwinia billingiae]|uniref:EAL domain-containing protein n=1 Tax=Erwinia billingiae TaxID=182337 RepID=UPI0032078DD1
MDDFGAGYSNVSHLQRIPLDIIMLDHVLVSDISLNSRSRIIATSIIRMLKALGYTVVAERIEGRVTVLAAAGCDQAQDHYYSRPLPATDITPLLTRGKRGKRAV